MIGILLAAAGLLVVAGATKVARPHDTARALRVPSAVVRVGAAAEATIGALALVTAWGAMAVAASYAAFAVYVAVALGQGRPLATCGCFGEPDTPPSHVHVAVDLVLAGGAAAAGLTQHDAPLATIGQHPAWGGTVVVLAAVVGGLAYAAMVDLPRLGASR